MLLAVIVWATGCQSTPLPAVKAPVVEVDTPELRELKAATKITDCVAPPTEPHGDLPAVELPCLGGGEGVNLATLRGPMVVNLWAQWCEPCERELPIYEEFHQTHQARVPVLGVNWQDVQPAAALRMAQAAGVSYPQLADTQPVIRAQALPKLILLDDNGNIAFEEYIEIVSLSQLEGLVSQHLGVKLR